MQLRSKLLAATLLAAPLVAISSLHAHAQPVTGLYVGAGVGPNWLQDETIRLGSQTGYALKSSYNTGIGAVASIGYGLGNGLRIELEGNFRDNSVRELSGTPFPTRAGGSQQTSGAMLNAYYDFDIGLDWIYPYIGVGAGWAHNTMQSVDAAGANYAFYYHTNGENDNFAYQAMLGASFPMAWMPGLSLTAEYRFYGEPNPGGFGSAVYAPNAAGATVETHTKSDIDSTINQSLMLGLRYAFNVAPPPPPPAPAPVVAPAPAPARSYLVFFDWDRADLTDRARQVIAEAAQNSTHVQYTRIEVNGYTDTSGTPQYNMDLSMRRANNVAAELVRDGVPRNVIDIHGFGETHPLVPTGPGVREPQNRRVEIIIG